VPDPADARLCSGTVSSDVLAVAALGTTILALLWVDLKLFARGRDPSVRESAIWSGGWLAISVLAAVPVWVLGSENDAVLYVTIYLIERSLSLDNLFVFLLLFAYFAVPTQQRAPLLFWGIVVAIVLRGLAIVGGVALIERFHFVIYVLGAALLVLSYRILRGVEESVDPANNPFVRGARRLFPVTSGFRGGRWFVRERGRLHTTPLFLCLAAVVFADIAFAIDSIPAAFAITREPLLIWMGNVFALLGLRALFVLVDGLIKRFRYLDETIAIVLAVIAVKLLIEDLYKVGPEASLAVVLGLLAGGITASVIADRREASDAPERRTGQLD
jgi:tellurite resistance protein TerC